MAFWAWIFVSLNSNDTKGKTISGIAIDMQQVDESIGKLGLSTISAEQPKVTVRVEGVIYDIGNLTASDVRPASKSNLTAWKPLPWTSKQGCPGTAHRQTII